MNLHEYQAKQLLAARGVPVPAGGVCETAEQARAEAERLRAAGATQLVVKAQIHAGGRGKGVFVDGYRGGVKLVSTPGEAEAAARAMLGNVLITRQTGPAGRRVRKVLVAEAPEIRRELYVAVLLDRARGCPVVMASTEGGVEIEEVAARAPEKIVSEPVDPLLGWQAYQGRKLAVALGLTGAFLGAAVRCFEAIYRTWWECEASLVEINPFCVVAGPQGERLMAVDAKMALEDNALFRHPDLAALRDEGEESPLEVEAGRHHLNYIKLDGDIACLVNGAGLAMATMDIIKHYGGEPANFLDVGGGASVEQVTAAFRIIMQDPNVRAILVNIFGGIMDCDVIARGIVAAVRETGLRIPLVVRLEGNNVEAGRRTLAEAGLSLISADSMADAARKVVAAARGTGVGA
ncbi:ADP-forming succinate--CoA ligase subunit beta [Limisphaera ngatamarikiensis]|uniref:Succinate--CoA ligase [ADP-forming] subunit beta n=1 Tax=Limisphaera ngatamarikiensis TaxID=1324935 RepID=A0A6M1RR83_9BACT|nr:ADP-forming succinate--CoA ligase subunit beta [Limisphaera ngatamarikiensis]NGO39897.1 ADP-forming succinate--CoA ligase subunit beta [Limisphaera ngatamarikiensis]